MFEIKVVDGQVSSFDQHLSLFLSKRPSLCLIRLSFRSHEG